MSITQSILKELLHYDPKTGIFTWVTKPKFGRVQIGDIAGCKSHGYIYIKISGIRYPAHHLAWLYMFGKWPIKQLDHKDTIRHHNWINNLRESTQSQNRCNSNLPSNNKSGVKGISWHKATNMWRATATFNKKHHHLGYLKNIDDAAIAHQQFAILHHGEFYKKPL